MGSFGASAAHQGLWLAQEMAPDTLNHALSMWEVDGDLDPAAMESAFLHVMGEAEVLRVNFADDGTGLRLVPRELRDWRPFLLDLRAEADPERAAREALADLLRQPFDLDSDLLFRFGTVRLADTRSLVVLAYHHLISDGFGVGGLLSRRLAEVYTALVRGTAVPELPHLWDAASYAAEAADYLASQKHADDTEFWRDYLKDAPPPAQAPSIALPEPVRAALDEPLGAADRWSELTGVLGMVSRTLTVPRAEADTWTNAAKAMGVWMSSLLTAAAAAFFRHRCSHPEILLSLAVGNRSGKAGRTPGLAVNVVPVRLKVPLGATFGELAEAVVDETYEVLAQAACHYSDIQRAAGTVLSSRGSFGAVVNFVDFAEQLHFGDSPARYFGGTTGTFDELAIGVCTDGTPGSDLYIRLDAPASLYSGAELRLIGEGLIDYLRAAVESGGELPVGRLDVVRGAERERVLTAPKDTEAPLPGLTVPELFARRVAEAPDDAAVVSGEETVSYRVLDERSGHLAEVLRARGVGPGTIVAVALPRSAELVVAVLGVAKAGAAYLAVDPALPAEIEVPVGAVLTDTATAEASPVDPGVPTIRIDALHDDARDPLPRLHPADVLAVTRGVAVTHCNVERHVSDRRWSGDPRTVLWHAPHAFDAFVFEVWTPLLTGGRVVVAPPGELSPDVLAAHEAATVWLPAGLLASVAARRPESGAGLREVWTGGDRVSEAVLERMRQACPGLAIWHGYGTAETGGHAAAHQPGAGDVMRDVLGGPSDNTALYVLGPGLTPVPVGVAGDLYVAGSGVARGYPARPGRTAERFVPCPYGPPGGLMVRTGDRARWAHDGRLEHAGRTGVHARIRGVPVEPAEVEAGLSGHPGLAQSAGAVRDDEAGQQRLVAYAVPMDPRTGLGEDDLRRFAAERLPEPLVPSAFVVLDRLPMTIDGRVDRDALPSPEAGGGDYRAPRNATERVLAAAFAEVLERDRVGIDDDFFDLGGNSLRAIRLVGLIRAELNQEVTIRMLFVVRTIAGLSAMWNDLAQSSRPSLRRRTKDGEIL